MMNAVADRQIRYLVHFTRAQNLDNIIKYGLIPVGRLRNTPIVFSNNDEYRIDGCEEANCLSIEFPNYKMFYSYRKQFPEIDWVVLGIRKEVLWEKDCAFCVENAASNTIRNTSLESRKGIEAFRRLYDDYPSGFLRRNLNIIQALPTHPQAEVLVFDNIEPEFIWGVAFQNLETQQRYAEIIPPNINSQVKPQLFMPRNDYENWR